MVPLRQRGAEVKPSCAEVTERMFSRARLKEQSYDSTLSVLRLSKKYGDGRLEAACTHALPKSASPRYRNLKATLDSNLDEEPKVPEEETPVVPTGTCAGRNTTRSWGDRDDRRGDETQAARDGHG
ncbi:hypothetical protein ADJ70_02785 [Olsenella sp. oral taxon 807]|nr:hypothetical protein ADJ70_02785 [Olsenella sp. oral taxon 807]